MVARISKAARAATVASVVSLASVSALCGQSHQSSTPTAPEKPAARRQREDDMPLLRTPAAVSPWQTFQHLRQGNQRLIQVSPKGKAAPMSRTFGLGKRIAAVLAPAGMGRSPAALFAVLHRDLLVLSSPGPVVSDDAIARLEYAVRTEQVSLLVILVNPGAPMFTARDPFPGRAGRRLRQQLERAKDLAHRDRLSVPIAHGILQTDAVWLASPLLEKKRLQGRFQIALGLVADKTGAITWVTRWHERLQLLSSASAKELVELRIRERKARRDKKAHDARHHHQTDKSSRDRGH